MTPAGTCPICSAAADANVAARDNALVSAFDDARVDARDNAVVNAYANATVYAADRVTVYAFGRATVYARGRAHVVVYSPDVTVHLLERYATAEVWSGAGDWRHDWRPASDHRKADAVRDQLAQALDLLRSEGAS